ncbi:unnamed protein product [Acanthoscelides obtectus]|uniref:Uncharacterized protein n=1 Tax=Acanthoscelides obtectus TaxID=200917 RepID=A0A9P0MGM2_ACAOB|nr:unnamed protein product [Acanthoscelides obtectus]CAK1682912.1 hypothetical protein AOBTE_LOCUS33983 [Acanthoscelides obtectus]
MENMLLSMLQFTVELNIVFFYHIARWRYARETQLVGEGRIYNLIRIPGDETLN